MGKCGPDFAACFSASPVPPPGKKSEGREADGLKFLQVRSYSNHRHITMMTLTR
jgi:hypothetical protein